MSLTDKRGHISHILAEVYSVSAFLFIYRRCIRTHWPLLYQTVLLITPQAGRENSILLLENTDFTIIEVEPLTVLENRKVKHNLGLLSSTGTGFLVLEGTLAMQIDCEHRVDDPDHPIRRKLLAHRRCETGVCSYTLLHIFCRHLRHAVGKLGVLQIV